MTHDNYPAANPAPTTRTGATANVLSIVAFVLSAVAVLFLPIVFGPLAIIAAIIGLVRKEGLAKIAIIVAIVATILGFVLGAVALNAMS